ncbi:MAG TPA: hypothetical protein VL117_10100 [Thermoleophilia bacterium]|nr:hypothetical protein [Thermoleophilia bacterium]
MPSCATCGTSVRDAATHCTTCGTPTGFAPAPPPPPAPVPVVSPPSPFESEASWRDPMPPIVPEGAWNPAPMGHRPAAPSGSRRTSVIVAAALLTVVVAVLAVVALPRLLGGVDPQKYVGTWSYPGVTPASVTVTRQDAHFTIAFVDESGARQTLPGKISDGKLVIDYDALGPQGPIIKKLAESIGAKLSFDYRRSDDRLVLAGSNSQGSFTTVLHRSASL